MDNSTTAPSALTGYRVHLPLKDARYDNGTGYSMIRFASWYFYLPKTNKAKCRCMECQGQIKKGQGIWQKEKGGKRGFTCLRCVGYLVKKWAAKGLREDIFCNLYPASFDQPTFTVDQVLDALKPVQEITPAAQ